MAKNHLERLILIPTNTFQIKEGADKCAFSSLKNALERKSMRQNATVGGNVKN